MTEATSETVLHVGGASPYDVVVGHHLADRLPAMVGDAHRVAIIAPDPIEHLVDEIVPSIADLDLTVLMIPDGEEAKTAEVANSCWEALGEEGFTRSDVVVTLGGGATTDLGGFVAASWLRGVRVVHVPTTLLAMVDAAVGGKTGINTAAGKNLVGAFHEPTGVLCDLALLESLPRAELVSGLGEVVKCGFIADPEILRLVEETDPDDLVASSPVLRELVERAIRVKIDVVVGDLKETGGVGGHPGREALNYGHTLAHAIERAEDYTIRHGEAVAIGCVFVAELAHRAAALPAELVERHRAVFGRVGLPTTYDAAPFDDLLATMRVDKKARGDRLRFVVLDDVGRPTILSGPSEDRPARGVRGAVDGRRSLMTRVLVLNGPNLGRLGRRQPEIYGSTTHAELAHRCVEWGAAVGLEVEVRQTNHEGELLDWLNDAADDGTPVVLNAAAWTHYSYALFDACAQLDRSAGGGAHLRPLAAARGVPPHLGGHAARRPRGGGPGDRGLPDRARHRFGATGGACINSAAWPPPTT